MRPIRAKRQLSQSFLLWTILSTLTLDRDSCRRRMHYLSSCACIISGALFPRSIVAQNRMQKSVDFKGHSSGEVVTNVTTSCHICRV